MASETLRAADLTASVGVNTHLDFANYGYQNLAQTEAAIQYLGVSNLRDSPGNANDVSLWGSVAAATGVKFDAFIGETSPAGMSQELSYMPALAQAGLLNYVEGGNEEDDSYPASLGNTLDQTAAFQSQVYQTAHSLGLPAINMSFGAGWTAANNWHGDYDKVGDLSSVADYANAHTYPAGGSGQPGTAISQLNADAHLADSSDPVINTEIGWDNASTDPTSAAKYGLDAVMDGLQQGDVAQYFYALYDDGSGQFGLFNADGSPKPIATAIHNLMGAMQDTGASAATFTPTALNYTLGGTLAGDNSLAFQKSDGSYVVSLWDEQQDDHTVTLAAPGMSGTVQVYDPLTGATTAASVSNGTVAVTMTDHPVLVEIPAQASGATAPAAPAGGTTLPPVGVTAPGSATSTSGVQLGAYVGNPNNADPAEQAATTAQFQSLASAVGQTPTVMDTYVDGTHPNSQWAGDAQWAADSWAAAPWSKGLTPVIGLPMGDSSLSGDAAFKAIASGQFDSAINGALQAWANDGFTSLYLRPGFEMNGNWMPWSVDSSNAADFVAAFQHIADLAHSFQGATVQTVWNPNVGGDVDWSSTYPGDQAVDVVGLDTYGAPVGGDAPGAASTGPDDLTLTQALSFAQAHGKPFALPETGGLDATFAQQLGSVVAGSGAQVAFVNLWDVNDSSGNLSWSNASDNQGAVASAWKQAIGQIDAANSGTATGTPTAPASPPTTPASGSGSASQPVGVTAPPTGDAGAAAGAPSSADSSDPGMQVSLLYQAALDRLPDAGGFGYWRDGLQGGATLQQEAQGFLGSAEYTGSHTAGLSDSGYVSSLYQTALGRAPEAAGLQAWTADLAGGATRAQVLVGIGESPEAFQHNASGIIAAGFGH